MEVTNSRDVKPPDVYSAGDRSGSLVPELTPRVSSEQLRLNPVALQKDVRKSPLETLAWARRQNRNP